MPSELNKQANSWMRQKCKNGVLPTAPVEHEVTSSEKFSTAFRQAVSANRYVVVSKPKEAADAKE